jgi:hypothetical protein
MWETEDTGTDDCTHGVKCSMIPLGCRRGKRRREGWQ